MGSSQSTCRADEVRKGDQIVLRSGTFEVYADPRPGAEGYTVLAYNGHVGTFKNDVKVMVIRG